MTYPSGVQLSTLTFNSPLTYLGNPVTRTEITVQVSAGVVWAATGDPINDAATTVALGPGMPGAVTFPAVNQPGFTDQSGTATTMWSYVVTRKLFFGSASQSVQKNWQPLTGQATVDFDSLPGDGGSPTFPPSFPVTSVAGQTGVVDAASLAGALVPFIPPTDVSGKLNATAVGAPSGVAPLGTDSKVPDTNLPAASNAAAVAGKADKTSIAAASDPIAYLNNVAILCQFPVRENGETFWPQGISINKAANEIYVSNASSDAATLRIDVRDFTTGVRKSYKQISVTAATWSEGLPWFNDGSGNLCFIVRTTPETGAASTYSIYNYTTNTLGSPIAINGPFKSDVNGDTFVTSDAYSHAATTFYIYSWASIKAGTPTLLATVPLENTAQDINKTQGVAVVGNYLYILCGDQSTNPSVLVYDFTGKLITVRDYAKADFKNAVNALKPGYLTIDTFVYECEGATNLDGKLVTGQIVNNNPAVTADGIMLVLQHNRIDGAHIKSQPMPNYVRDTGWVTLTPASGWTIGGSGNIQARRVGNEVRLRGNPLNSSAAGATWITIATVPAGMRPILSTQFSQSSNTTATMAVRVNPGGTIECWSSVSTGAWRVLNGITYALD